MSFVAGQPLGYYASWALFALSHHLVVWYAAERVYPAVYFQKYAALGDDVIIADDMVAQEYKTLVQRLGVSISEQKPLISHSGAGEFAKKFRVSNMRKDMSPISIRALKNFYHPYGLMALNEKYKLSNFRLLCRVGGAGHKRLARLSSILKSKKYSRLYAMYSRPTGGSTALEWFLGRGKPLNPYLRGLIIKELRNKLRPKDLKVAPLYCYPVEQVSDFQEYAMLRCWMKEWLQYVKWYAQTALSPDITIEKFFDSPMGLEDNKEGLSFGPIWNLLESF